MTDQELSLPIPTDSKTSDNVTGSSSKPSSSAESAPAPPPPPPPAPVAAADTNDDDDMLLVTEFPPPPYYYTLASRNTPSHLQLTPPEIPRRAFRVAAKKVMEERKKAREESERIRLEAEVGQTSNGGVGSDGTVRASSGEGGSTTLKVEIETTTAMDAEDTDKNATLQPKKGAEGVASSASTVVAPSSTTAASAIKDDDDYDSIDPDDPNEPVVAVFGEIVEDPTLVVEEECHDPVIIRENVKRLNRTVLNGFLKLVQTLVHDPNDNKKLRDELSHNLFLMLQECNKFREHQAREILIDTLEEQLERRKEGLALLQGKIAEADEALMALEALEQFREN